MRICLFHPKLLPPKDYGGVERVVLWLAKGLIERGHEVHVAALEGSQLPQGARLIPMSEGNTSAWDLLPQIPQGTQIVHFMAPPEPGVLEKLPCPGVLTVHGNGKPGEQFPINTVFLSQDHARRHGAEFFVYNGIDPAEYSWSSHSRGNHFLFLSKTSWRVKNLAGAMSICSEAGASLKIAGGQRPWALRLKAAFSSRTQWLGAVSGEQKANCLAQARALLFPVIWPEPFGLVVVEALMSGTPVIASRIGSLPELITPDTGMLLDPPVTPEARKQWVAVVGQEAASAGSRWRAQACRERAMTLFHYLKMAEGYENAYNKVISGRTLQPAIPVAPVAKNWRIHP